LRKRFYLSVARDGTLLLYSIFPVTGLSGVMGDSDNQDIFVVFNDDKRKGKLLDEEFFGSYLASFTGHGNKRGIWFL